MIHMRRITVTILALLAIVALLVPLSTASAGKGYTIDASAGIGGTITPSGTIKVGSGGSQSFTIAADTGYRIVDVLVDGGSVGAQSSYTFSDVQADHTIAASFVAPYIYFANPSALPGVEFGMNLYDFAPNASGVVWFDTDGDGIRDAAEPQSTVTVNLAGSGSPWPHLSTPADAEPGVYSVYADVPEGEAVEASAGFTVRGMILSPASGTSGTVIAITGLGFATDRTGTVWFDSDGDSAIDADEPQVAASTDSGGTLSPVSLTVPAVAGGSYYVRADVPTGGFVPDVSAAFVVLGAPVAAFTSDVQSGTAPLTVQFTDQSTGDPASWAWDFENDGTPDSTDQNPTYTYASAGTFTVKLTATNAVGSDDEIKPDYINVTTLGPKTWYVDDSGGADFMTIQAAVTAASGGDTIIVRDGTYNENVVVDKNLAIQSESGAASTTVTAVVSTAPVFDVNASGVVIDGFSVLGPTDTHVAGIELVDVNDCTIRNNDCSGGLYNGIHLGGAATNNIITKNYCHGNTQRGISVRDTAHGNFISENTVEDNGDAGFCIKDETHDNIIWLNNVIGNRVEMLTANTYNSLTPLAYGYNGGTYTGYLGNYYYDYTGSDADGNGVGDTLYSFGTYSDNYPLMGEWHDGEISVSVVAPTAAFTASPTSGTAPLAVSFSDQSTGTAPLTYAWDFDNDGVVDSTDQNPSHVYSAVGTYTVKLTVTNAASSDDEVKTDYITVNSAPVAPTAAFIASPTSGTAPLAVSFSDQSTGTAPLTYAWDFDNDGVVDSTDQNPSHVYSAVGTYTVKLTVANAGGSDDEIKTGFITVTMSSTPAWDLNGDHTCNIGDVVVIGLRWGDTGTPGWIPEDLNNDGAINIGDVVVIGLHWGESW
ncbi:MAG: PKD domain-containing protein [Dehalococcoidia bacterium]|nr:PKD domain-containing protein [Dehalococcoidia bacterium]